MVRGRNDKMKAKASTAKQEKEALDQQKALVKEETSSTSEEEEEEKEDRALMSEEEEDDDSASRMEIDAAVYWSDGLADKLSNGGLILVLVGTPSGFAIFSYDGVKLLEQNAYQNIWADFADLSVAKRAVVLKDFLAVGDKFSGITSTGVSDALGDMIKRHITPGQTLAVENEDYQIVIEHSLEISCLYGPIVEELMWGLKIQVPYLVPAEKPEVIKEDLFSTYLVPAEKPEVIKEDLFSMSEGMKWLLDFHGFKFKPGMMVTRLMIRLAGLVYECDRCVNKHNYSLRRAAEHLAEVSQIDTQDWDLMKLATALKMICYPKEKVKAPPSLFSKQELARMGKDAHKYEDKILKEPLLVVYDEICWARKSRLKAARVLSRMLRLAAKAQEPPTDHKISPDGEEERSEHRGFVEEVASTECNYSLVECKKRQIPPTLAPIDALKRYTCISSQPLHSTSKPGILSVHIHPSKDIVATGGIDTNTVLFDRPSGQILCTLTGHSKRITSLKFINWDELFITGSADKTVRIWRAREDGNYSCIHTLKDHTAEVEAVTVHATRKYLATASKDHTWCIYDILTGSCMTQVSEASQQKGYTSATFHPNSLVLGTGTTTAVALIWDVRTECIVAKLEGHVGPVADISFSENGYHLATAALDGVRLWDARKLRSFKTISSTPANAVEFDLSGSYLAVGGSDTGIYQVDKLEDNVIKTLPDLSGTGKVTSLKFGADARYIAVGSMDCNLRIFGLR